MRVGGRVVAIDGNGVTLADALGELRLRSSDATQVAVGDLAVFEARLARGRPSTVRLVERSPGKPPDGASEFGRLAGSVGRVLVARALALRVVRDYFDDERFVEVETPIRVRSPGLDAYVDAVKVGDRWLITSPELAMKRLLVGGLPRIYQIARVTRADEVGDWHEPEFSMLEWYRSFSTVDAIVSDTERIVHGVVRALTGTSTIVTSAGARIDARPPFARITVRDAFRIYAGVSDAADLAATDVDRYFQTFVDDVEPGISHHQKPVLLTEFPITQGALARPCAHDDSVSERFELYAGGIELSNGFGELTDPVEQRRRFEAEQARRRRAGAPDHPIDERFLTALEEGMPPSGGNALGFDRLVALALGLGRIADVMAFPMTRA